MKIHTALIIVILLSAIMLGTFSFMNDLGDYAGKNTTWLGLNASEKQLTDTYNDIDSNFQELSNTSVNTKGITGFFYNLPSYIIAGGSIVKSLISSWATVGTTTTKLFSVMGEIVPIPRWVGTLISTLLIVGGIIILLYYFTKWRHED